MKEEYHPEFRQQKIDKRFLKNSTKQITFHLGNTRKLIYLEDSTKTKIKERDIPKNIKRQLTKLKNTFKINWYYFSIIQKYDLETDIIIYGNIKNNKNRITYIYEPGNYSYLYFNINKIEVSYERVTNIIELNTHQPWINFIYKNYKYKLPVKFHINAYKCNGFINWENIHPNIRDEVKLSIL